MSDEAGDDVRGVARAIVRYLSAHPDAADTVRGVARWWLGEGPGLGSVERAMVMLVARGLVERHTLPEGTTVYRAGPRLGSAREDEEGL
jgi:hypothetical protein